ncbi:MAG: hypothetical protein ACXVH3_29710 [Solirubrobacteraceae bacterium]
MHEITVTNLRARQPLRILFLVSAHNGLSQRAWIALTELGHKVYVAVVDSAAAMEAAVAEHDPELIVCPFLKTLIGTFPARGMVEQWLKGGWSSKVGSIAPRRELPKAVLSAPCC